MKKNENVLLWMHRHEAKAGIRRTSVEHGLGTFAKWIYILAFVWAMLMNGMYFLSVYIQRGHTLDVQDGKDMSILFEDYISVTSGSLILVSIMSALLIVGIASLFRRYYILCLGCNIIPAVILLLHFKARMSDLFAVSESIPISYLFRHLIPLALLTAAVICYCIIGILYNISENRAYDKFVSKIYEQHPDRFGKMTDEEWDEFLNSYEPPTKKQAKKARKAKNQETEN